MFGFYSFSENPFSSASVVSAGEVKTGVAVLSASGVIAATGSLNALGSLSIENSGSIESIGSVIIPGQSLLQGSGNLSPNLSRVSATVEGAGSLSSSGNFDSNGTIIHGAIAAPNASGELTSDSTIIHGGFTTLEASGSLGVSESVEFDGASLLLDAGTVTANGTLVLTSDSSLQASGELSGQSSFTKLGAANISVSGSIVSDNSLIITGDATLTASGEFTSDGKVFKTSFAQISSSGTLGSIGTFNKITAGSNLESPGATIIAGKFAPGELTASLSASSSITAQIGLDLESQAIVGNTAKEFLKKTSRPNYKPALPKLSNKDEGIILDFPFHEGAGNLRSVSSRRQSGNSNMLMWGRVDGRQSLTSLGGNYNNYRISFDSTDFNFSDGSLVISFKPTLSTASPQFLFGNRGTGSNNNEIDIYALNTANKVRIDIYNGTSKQTLDVPNLSFNSWNTLIVTFGSNLNASLNGNDFSTYSSITMPSVNSSTSYILGNVVDFQGMAGSIDHFRLYDRQISQTYAKQLHRNIYQDYSLDYIIPNHYEMTRVTSSGRLMRNSASNISASGQIISRGSFLLAKIKAAIGGLGQINANGLSTPLDITTASLQAAATIAANGILLGELDVVPFTVFINQLEDYNIDVYRTFVKEFNVAKSKAISASIEKTNITDINIDKILEANLEK
jgi:hypothetical protein